MLNENEFSVNGFKFKRNTQMQNDIQTLNVLSSGLDVNNNFKTFTKFYKDLFSQIKDKKNIVLVPSPDRAVNKTLCKSLSLLYKHDTSKELKVLDSLFIIDKNSNIKINENINKKEYSDKQILFFDLNITNASTFQKCQTLCKDIQPFFYYVDKNKVDIEYTDRWNIHNKNNINYNASYEEIFLEKTKRLYDLEDGLKNTRERLEYDETLSIIQNICNNNSCLLRAGCVPLYTLSSGKPLTLDNQILNDDKKNSHYHYTLKKKELENDDLIMHVDNRNNLFSKNVKSEDYVLIPVEDSFFPTVDNRVFYRNLFDKEKEKIQKLGINETPLINTLTNYRINSYCHCEYQPIFPKEILINDIQKHSDSFYEINKYVQKSILKAENLTANVFNQALILKEKQDQNININIDMNSHRR